MSSPVWLITGVSNGFGQILARRVLQAGHRVIGTVRNRTKSAQAVQELVTQGSKIIELDTTESQHVIISKMESAVRIYGQIDILVNNAAYAALGVMEGFSDTDIVTQYKTNVFGPLYVIQGVLPSMRSRKSGMVVNMSSYVGQYGGPAGGLYASSKFALEGLTESLSEETSEFGIKWLLPEFGAFRTNFLGKDAFASPTKGIPSGYEGSIGEKHFNNLSQWDRKQPGDPIKGIERLFEVITGAENAAEVKNKVLRVMIGGDAIDVVTKKIESLKHDLELSKKLEDAQSTAAE